MAKVGLLLPYADMLQMTEELVGDYKLDIVYKKLISSASAVKEARLAVDAGAEIIVARGYQAMQIKRFTNIPVAEMDLRRYSRKKKQYAGGIRQNGKKILYRLRQQPERQGNAGALPEGADCGHFCDGTLPAALSGEREGSVPDRRAGGGRQRPCGGLGGDRGGRDGARLLRGLSGALL